MKKYNLQVEKEHYFDNYDSKDRFLSYYEQVSIVKKINPKSVLEIGVGNNFVNSYLKNLGFNIESFDFDKNLNPMYVGDIRELKDIITKKYELVCAFEVLEHLPFKDFELALKNLYETSTNYVVFSIPYSCAVFSFKFKFNIPKINLDKTINLKIPYFFYSLKFGFNHTQHYWELGSKNHSKKIVRNIILKKFKILKEYHLKEYPKHYFYILKKK